MRHRQHLALALGAALLCACPAQPPSDPPTLDMPTGPVARAAQGNLRLKSPEQLSADYAAALELPADALCTELGQYQCVGLVHNVALGGVEPYGTGLYEPSGVTAAATPLVVERVAWSACTRRVDADLKDPAAAVLFGGVPLAGARLADPGGPALRAAIGQLVQRGLQRDVYAVEVARYTQLARDIEASGSSEPARASLQALCFAVLTSAEAIFY